ncbi:hypothetical protein [Phaeobacter porticola]|uniref:Uncharacterized protein n=1 Tax=Phaeobacter porticola TaxID=1844006 RepID=A0A1L3I3N7_9RHOB|nr:hypothetical protein [Phaeobacter porticola]APG46744.1 hypothetical protein PhaeoP97_01320 [Phaeobacter porticola]
MISYQLGALPGARYRFMAAHAKVLREGALRNLKAQEVTLGGLMWLDLEQNAAEDMAVGKTT